MNIFITGNRGFVGKEITKLLEYNKHTIIGFDLIEENDIHDMNMLTREMKNCDVVIHLAAIETDSALDTLRTNLLGTNNVLHAMENNKIQKMIFMSSVDALGIFQGEGNPVYLPLDDDYPCHPTRPYSISKKLAEEACKMSSQKNGISFLCIRSPGIWNQETYKDIENKRKNNPEYEWSPYWEYGAFIDIRDLSSAIHKACITNFNGFHCYGIAATDITTSGMTSLELIKKLRPTVSWKGGNEYLANPYKSLIDCTNLQNLLNWKAQYSWKVFKEENFA
jgi:UDP-glucose 4-epimerase